MQVGERSYGSGAWDCGRFSHILLVLLRPFSDVLAQANAPFLRQHSFFLPQHFLLCVLFTSFRFQTGSDLAAQTPGVQHVKGPSARFDRLTAMPLTNFEMDTPSPAPKAQAQRGGKGGVLESSGSSSPSPEGQNESVRGRVASNLGCFGPKAHN